MEIDLTTIPIGKSIMVRFKQKPIFVRHRTREEIEAAQSVPLTSLIDPERDEDRVKNPQWLVVVGICSHLGVPLSHHGDYDGFYCPCHGNHFDTSGRTRKGPAPLNMRMDVLFILDNCYLEVPPHDFAGPNTLRLLQWVDVT